MKTSSLKRVVEYAKKGMVMLCACLWSAWCLGQEPVKEFVDKHGRVVEKQGEAAGYQMVVRDAKSRLNGPIIQYDSLGRKTMSGAYVDGNHEGMFEHYHPNGQLRSKVAYRADWLVGRFESWYGNGKPKEVGNFSADTTDRRRRWQWEVYRIESFWDSTGTQLVENGTGSYYDVHDNGKVAEKGAYRGGAREGEWLFYDKSGRQTNTEQYVKGRLAKGLYQGPGGDQFTYDSETFEVIPEYPGGIRGLSKYLSKSITFPKEARRQRVNGTVFVGFIIQADGKVSDVHVLKGIHPACDAEAVRVVEIMPAWQAGRQQGRPVPVRYSLPIRFVSM
ncbi:MAG TPA: TonB family protein [Cytophagales bacterium]|jgi:TonB family protein